MLLDAVSLLITPLLHGGELVLIGAFLSTRGKGGREGGRKRGREEGWEERREGERERGREGGREGGREREEEGGREREGEGERAMKWGRGDKHCTHNLDMCIFRNLLSEYI